MPTDACTAGNANTAGYSGILTNYNVVRNLYLIIENHASLNYGRFYGTTVNCSISPDMYTLPDSHTTGLLNLHPGLALPGVAETLGTDDSARLNSALRTYGYFIVDSYPWKQMAVFTNLHVLANNAMGGHANPVCNMAICSNDYVRTDTCVW
jgi:hypothetical protein